MIRVAVLGAGGLGKAAAKILALKREMRLTAMCDSKGFVIAPEGVDADAVIASGTDLVAGYRQAASARREGGGVAVAEQVELEHHADPLGAIIERADAYDAVFLALPNLPNDFIPTVIDRFAASRRSLAFSDVLKRTTAVEQLFTRDAA
ncbi:MAG: hypothetical protein Q8S13_09075, partial [Dehalococcoidia bacterium]|nr:hypothetical protein [Dehalococcoidia bacterium]